MRYAALKVLIFLIIGIVCTHYLKIPNWFLIAAFIISIVITFLTKWYSLYFSLIIVSALNYNSFLLKENIINNFPYYDRAVKIKAQILETPIYNNRYLAKLLTLNNLRITGKVFLFVTQENETVHLLSVIQPLRYGDVIDLDAQITDFDFPCNPNLFDYNSYYHKQGLIGSIFTTQSNIKIIRRHAGNWFIKNLIIPLRNYFFNTISQYLESNKKALLIGLLLGEKQEMSEKLRQTFADTGIAHILAVSGLHIAILIGILLLLLPIIRVRGLLQLAIIIVVIFIYLSIIGFKISAVRAGLMALFVCLGLYTHRYYNPINSVLVAAIIILLFSPQAIFEISFQLSFIATLGIIMITPKLYNIIKKYKIPKYITRYLLLPFLVSLSATISIAPIVLNYFFQFPLLTVFANLLIIPLVSLAMPLGFLVMFLNLLIKGLAAIYAQTLWLILKLIIYLSEKFSNLSWQNLEFGKPPLIFIALFYLFLLMIIFWKNLRFRKLSAIFLLVGLNFYIWQNILSPQNLIVTFFDLKKGDAILLELPNRKTMLIDAGEPNEIILPLLKSKRIKNIDLAVITHPHFDHYGGYQDLINTVKIKQFLIATDTSSDTTYQNLINRLRNNKQEIFLANENQSIATYRTDISVFYPNPISRKNYEVGVLSPNDISVVLKLNYENISLLFPGDLDNFELIQHFPLQAQFLKIPHHGSKVANNPTLINKVQPEYVIITGRKTINPDVLRLFKQHRLKIFNTRKNGALIVLLSKQRIKIKQMNS